VISDGINTIPNIPMINAEIITGIRRVIFFTIF
jgi:hypothetical protein